MTVRPLCTLLALVVLSCAPAPAEPFWITYEADLRLFPEEVGWERIIYGGGAQRWFQEDALVLDGLGADGIEDFYRMDAPIELAPGERFVMQWRLRVDEVPGHNDPGVNFTVLGTAALTLDYGESTLYSIYEGVWIPFAPGVFHDYRITSDDLDTYTLRIDGEFVHTGLLAPTGWESGVEWGDYSRPPRSLSSWESVQFGVVAEPSGSAFLGLAALFVMLLRSPSTRRQSHETK